MLNIQAIKKGGSGTAVVRQWESNVVAAGGGFENNSRSIANNLVRVLQSRSYYGKILYLLPMLGQGINAARVPLLDVLGAGPATNTAFVDADFSQSTGLQGNGTSKRLDSLIKASALGGGNGGVGTFENLVQSTTAGNSMGSYSNDGNNGYTISPASTVSTSRSFYWGSGGTQTTYSSTAPNLGVGHWYGQRASATDRKLCKNGVVVATDTDSQGVIGQSERNILILGDQSNIFNEFASSRCALAYFTDGSLTTDEISDFHSIVLSYLFGPTGRPTS